VRVAICANLEVHEVRGSVQTLVWRAGEIWIISESRLLESIMNIRDLLHLLIVGTSLSFLMERPRLEYRAQTIHPITEPTNGRGAQDGPRQRLLPTFGSSTMR